MPLEAVFKKLLCLELSKKIEQLELAIEKEEDEKKKIYKELQLSLIQELYNSECRG